MAYEGNRYAGLNRGGQKDKWGWLDPALTAAGAVAGSMLMPGVGTMAGASLGAGMGHAAGSVGHSLANGQVDPMQIGQAALTIGSGYQAGQVPQTSISPQGGGTQPTLPVPEQSVPMENQQILQRFMQNPRDPMFQSFSGRQQWNPYTDQTPYGMKAFDNGGLVTGGGAMDQLLQMLQRQNASGSPSGMGVPSGPTQTPQGPMGASSDVLGAIPGQVQQMIGRGPDLPQMEAFQTARHPNWEAASSVLAQLLAAVPKPANPRNTKAIGAWAPALGVLAGAPADIAAGRRKSANADITTGNEARRLDYEKRKTAYDSQFGTLSNTLAGNATKPFAPDNSVDGPTVDIPGVGRVPATSGIAGDYLRKKHPELFPASVSSQERAAKQEGEQGDIEQLAHDIASFQAEPVVSMSGRSAQFGSQVRNRVNQLLREQGSPYSWNTLATLWNEKSKFYNTQNQQRFTQLRQSAVTVRQHINQFKQFYQQYASRVNPKDMRLLAGGMFGAARQGLLGPDAAASAQALEVTANALATETAMVLSGGYAPQAVQMEEARTMVDKALGQRSTKAGMDALEKLLEARIKNAVGATPFAGGRTNPYLIDASPLEGWGSAAQQEQPKPSGWKPKGAKLVEGK